jgi:asparagine synthetase B (glutamine-hydrolysing)
MPEYNLLWYNAVDIFHSTKGLYTHLFNKKPGFDSIRYVIQFFSPQISMMDRTETIKVPINSTILPFLKLPKFKNVNTNFEELCEKRARLLLDKAISTSRKLTIMYSGGIDSTLIMVSLLKVATDKELKENVIVLLTQASIFENESFFKNYIIKKCNIESTFDFTHFLGNNKYIVVTGETGDQLFGSMATKNFFIKYGKEFVFGEATYEKIEKIFLDTHLTNEKLNKEETSKVILPLFKVIKNAPLEITSVYHFFWWLNFTLKWQSVYTRTLAYTNPKYEKTLKMEDNYFAFFSDEEMQLWVMNNPDKLIRDDYKSYKYIAKDIIYKFDKNEDYWKNKVKWGSLADVFMTRMPAKFIDDKINFGRGDIPESIWNNENSFV